MKSWKTTITGILTLGLGIMMCIQGQFEIGVAQITAGIGLIFAGDAGQTK